MGTGKRLKKIALKCFENSKENYNLNFARKMAEILMNHEYKFGSLQEAKQWEHHYLGLNGTVNAQIKAMSMYGTVLNNYKMGLTLPKEDIISMVIDLEEDITYDSVWCTYYYYYYYYYYQIKSLLFGSKELEQMLLEAISIYENKYIKHSNFIVAFKIELINYYEENKDYDRTLKVTNEAISITSKDTIPYFNITYKQTELYTEMGDYSAALTNYTGVVDSPIYESIPEDHKMQ